MLPPAQQPAEQGNRQPPGTAAANTPRAPPPELTRNVNRAHHQQAEITNTGQTSTSYIPSFRQEAVNGIACYVVNAPCGERLCVQMQRYYNSGPRAEEALAVVLRNHRTEATEGPCFNACSNCPQCGIRVENERLAGHPKTSYCKIKRAKNKKEQQARASAA